MTESYQYSDSIMSDPAAEASRLKEFRSQRGWSQAELARRAGVSRAAVSAIEIQRLIPSVSAALKLACCLECTVEQLFGAVPAVQSKEWAWLPMMQQSRFWQAEVAGRLLLYPCEETAAGELSHDGIAARDALASDDERRRANVSPSQTLVVAGCDPAASLLAAEYARQTGLRMIVLRRSSGRALQLLKDGRVHVAGVHLASARGRLGNAEIVGRELGVSALLLRLAQWEEGVAYVANVKAATIHTLLQRRVRWIGREPGSGARQCLDELLPARKQPLRMAPDHRSVATALTNGWADAGVCVRLVSEEAGLRFLSVRIENYDLSFLKSTEADPRIQALIRVVRSAEYRRLLSDLPGYSVADAGQLQPAAQFHKSPAQ
jgi:molybdate-binding protein/transcriptional regulator with XRE-family HTH domain